MNEVKLAGTVDGEEKNEEAKELDLQLDERDSSIESKPNPLYDALTKTKPDFWRIFEQITPSVADYICGETGNTLLHTLVFSSNRALKKETVHLGRDENGRYPVCLRPMIGVLYRLTIYAGVHVNAVNKGGNTALHLAVLLPRTSWMTEHLIRLGTDGSIPNDRGVRVIFDDGFDRARLTKGFPEAIGGIWSATRQQEQSMLQSYLGSWCRVDCVSANGQKLMDCAYSTGDYKLIIQLHRARATNEMVSAAMALDLERVKMFAEDRFGEWNLFEVGYSQEDRSRERTEVAVTAGAAPGRTTTPGSDPTEWECHKGHIKKEPLQPDSQSAIQPLHTQNTHWADHVVRLILYAKCQNKPLHQAGLLKLMAKLSLVGADVQAKDKKGRTALVLAAELTDRDYNLSELLVNENGTLGLKPNALRGSSKLPCRFRMPDQRLLCHLLRLGIDASVGTQDGRHVALEQYLPQGVLRLCNIQKHLNSAIRAFRLPGIWPTLDALLELAEFHKGRPPMEELYARLNNLVNCKYARLRAQRNGLTPLQLVLCCRPGVVSGITKQEQHKIDHFARIISLLTPAIWTNEYIAAVLADDVDHMKYCLSYGKGKEKISSKLDDFFVGVTREGRAVNVSRPILIDIIQGCSLEAVELTLALGPDLLEYYEEKGFADQLLFWAFQPHVPLPTISCIMQSCPIDARSSRGCGLLVAILQLARGLTQPWTGRQKQPDNRDAWIAFIVQNLLTQGANICWRDVDGNSAVDLLLLNVFLACDKRILRLQEDYGIAAPPREVPKVKSYVNAVDEAKGQPLTPLALLDRHVAQLFSLGDHRTLERLVLDGYSRLRQANTGPPRFRSAEDIAQLCYFEDLILLLGDVEELHQKVCELMQAVVTNKVKTVEKRLNESKLITAHDWRSRNILHLAVIYEHTELVRAISELIPDLAYERDLLGYTPFHYALCLQDHRLIYTILAGNASVNLSIKDHKGRLLKEYIKGISKRSELIKRERAADLTIEGPLQADKTAEADSQESQDTAATEPSKSALEKCLPANALPSFHLIPVPGAYYLTQRNTFRPAANRTSRLRRHAEKTKV
ncbi:unnamed protein product [Schistocephalus solidus]|uniref:ANK_REP_REGION domain-containing protein n=1 Tax=Schistocephalus solidus TaxID=70667 RepID=A0A183SGN5_SCHSO|nr:unnamed protein product [Schistocephalus solidus]